MNVQQNKKEYCIQSRIEMKTYKAKIISHAAKGAQAAPASALVDELARRYQTAVINEYLTSKCCPRCGAWLLKARTTSVRFWRCADASTGSKEENKDYLAAFSMLQLGLYLAVTGKRLAPWRRSESSGEEAAAASTQSAKRAKKAVSFEVYFFKYFLKS